MVACGGQIRISNGVKMVDGQVKGYALPKKLVVAIQALEYDRSFLASRIFMDYFNGNLIISGAFGLFQKEMVILAGEYELSTMGEDMELVVKLHVFCRCNHIDYRIRYAPDAICWTQGPGKFSDLGVDLVLSGHDHLYARTFYMKGEESSGKDGGEKAAGEVLYVSGGSATGSKFYKQNDTDYPYLAFTQRPGEEILTFISVDASGIRIEARRISDGQTVDRCEIIYGD